MVELAQQAARFVRGYWSDRPRLAIVLGTGSGGVADEIDSDVTLTYEEIPHFSPCTALGHAGRMVCGRLCGIPLIALAGRCHYYEGRSGEQVTLPVRVLGELGVPTLILSNASGGLDPRMAVGDLLVVSDHLNLMHGASALGGGAARTLAGRSRGFYEPTFIAAAKRVARGLGIVLHEGVYVGVTGPSYETRAEYRAFRRLGADAVGMSTIPETVVAYQCGMRTLAISTITNVALPDRPAKTDAEQVVAIARSAEAKQRALVKGLLADAAIHRDP